MSVIGIILLFGLVTKNSILLVDLTIQKQETGLDRETALRLACPIRLRPILMTAVSMIFGVLPVALALGEGGEARAPMAVATIGGMITSTLLTLFLVPVIYAYMDRLATAARPRVALAAGDRRGDRRGADRGDRRGASLTRCRCIFCRSDPHWVQVSAIFRRGGHQATRSRESS